MSVNQPFGRESLDLSLGAKTPTLSLLYKAAAGESNYVDDEAIARDKDFAFQLQQRLSNFWLLDEPDGNWGKKSAAALARFKVFRGLLKEPGCGQQTSRELINTKPADLIKGYKLNGDLASRVLMFYCDRAFKITTKQNECNIFYLEGVNRDGSLNANNRFVYNDRRCILQFDNSNGVFIPKLTGNWLATSDPGKYYWDKPLNQNGCANIQKDRQYKAWTTGYHNDQYALVQRGSVTVLRGAREKPYSGFEFGINQHSVGKGQDFNFGDAIGKWSAGCSVGASRLEHDNQFMRQVDADPREKVSKGRYLHYTTFIKGTSLELAFPGSLK